MLPNKKHDIINEYFTTISGNLRAVSMLILLENGPYISAQSGIRYDDNRSVGRIRTIYVPGMVYDLPVYVRIRVQHSNAFYLSFCLSF